MSRVRRWQSGDSLAGTPADDGRRGLGRRWVRVCSPQPGRLFALLQRHGFAVQRFGAHELQVQDTTVDEVGLLAHFFQVPVHHVSDVEPSLGHADSGSTTNSAEPQDRRAEAVPGSADGAL